MYTLFWIEASIWLASDACPVSWATGATNRVKPAAICTFHTSITQPHRQFSTHISPAARAWCWRISLSATWWDRSRNRTLDWASCWSWCGAHWGTSRRRAGALTWARRHDAFEMICRYCIRAFRIFGGRQLGRHPVASTVHSLAIHVVWLLFDSLSVKIWPWTFCIKYKLTSWMMVWYDWMNQHGSNTKINLKHELRANIWMVISKRMINNTVNATQTLSMTTTDDATNYKRTNHVDWWELIFIEGGNVNSVIRWHVSLSLKWFCLARWAHLESNCNDFKKRIEQKQMLNRSSGCLTEHTTQP